MATLNERLLFEGERNGEADAPQASTFFTRKRVVLALLGVVGVACLVVGSVAASGVFSHTSPSTSSTSGHSFSVVDPNLLQRRPKFAAPLGSLANAPEPTIIASNDKTQTATLDFTHTRVTAQGQISHTQLSYTVVKHRSAHCPSTHESVLAIDCLPNRIRISFANASKAQEYAASWKNETILFLRAEWGCGSHIRQFVQHPVVDGRFLFAWTVNSSFAAAFPHANVSFLTNHTDDAGPVVLKTKNQTFSHASATGRHRRSFWDDVVSIFHDVADAASDLVKFAVTGDLDASLTPFNSQYTIPQTTLSDSDQSGDSVSLTYSGSLTITSNAALQIQDYSVQSISASAAASLSANAQLDLQVQEQYQSQQSTALTDSITIGHGTIDIFEVPVAFSVYVQVFGGYNAQASLAGGLTGTASASGSANAGFSYTPANGITTSADSQLSGSLSYSNVQARFNADVVAYVAPQAFLKLEYVGGPTATFVVYGEANLPNSCTVSQSIGYQVDVGAKLDIDIPHIVSYQATSAPAVVVGPTVAWTGSESVC